MMEKTDLEQTDSIEVEVVYAKPDEQTLVVLRLPAGSTVEEAINQSGLLALHPEIDLSVNKVGLYGGVCTLQQPLKKNDRVEIYRGLMRDPKDRRREKAAKK